jgi:hypothetical protein
LYEVITTLAGYHRRVMAPTGTTGRSPSPLPAIAIIGLKRAVSESSGCRSSRPDAAINAKSAATQSEDELAAIDPITRANPRRCPHTGRRQHAAESMPRP